MRTRVVIVEDYFPRLAPLAALLDSVPDIDVVGQAQTAESALGLIARLRPDVVVAHLGPAHAPELTREAGRCGAAVLVTTSSDDPEPAAAALGAGAAGYLVRDGEPERWVAAIRLVHRGAAVLESRLAPALLRPPPRRRPTELPPWQALSAREVDVLRVVARGQSNAEIAQTLGVSTATVRTHVAHIFAKLDVANRVQAVTEGIRRGLVRV